VFLLCRYLAQRLQFVILHCTLTQLKGINFKALCSCVGDDEGCDKCKIKFTLKIKNVQEAREVTEADLETQHPFVKLLPENKANVLFKIFPGQEVSLIAYATKGIGDWHAKFQPVHTAAFIPYPQVQINPKSEQLLNLEEKQAFVKKCPQSVFALSSDNANIIVKDERKCVYCKDCFLASSELLRPKSVDVTKAEHCLIQVEPSKTKYVQNKIEVLFLRFPINCFV
jgi:NAD-dependent dihydropyrimidine dehydrogenase PreA subunit